MNSIKIARLSAWTAAALGIIISPTCWAAPDANKIAQDMNKATQAIMNTSKTYQTTWETSINAAQGSVKVATEIKRIAAQGKTRVKVTPVGTPTGQLAMGAAMANLLLVDDGKNAYSYGPMFGGYMKQPHVAGNPAASFLRLPSGPQLTYKYLRADKIGGRPVHVIQMVPPQARGASGSQLVMYIDQSTNRLRQMTISMALPGQGGAPQTMQMKMVQVSEILDQPIAASTFVFTPPPGAKEVKGPPGGMPMGGLGAPGGGPRPPRPPR